MKTVSSINDAGKTRQPHTKEKNWKSISQKSIELCHDTYFIGWPYNNLNVLLISPL